MDYLLLLYIGSIGKMLVFLVPVGLIYGKLIRKFHLGVLLTALPVAALLDSVATPLLPTLTNNQTTLAGAVTCGLGIEVAAQLHKLWKNSVPVNAAQAVVAGKGKTGLVLSTQDGCTVLSVKPDSPASQAGLMSGDWIVSINGVICGDDYLKNASLLVGPSGSVVKLGVLRDGSTLDFGIIRADLH